MSDFNTRFVTTSSRWIQYWNNEC